MDSGILVVDSWEDAFTRSYLDLLQAHMDTLYPGVPAVYNVFLPDKYVPALVAGGAVEGAAERIKERAWEQPSDGLLITPHYLGSYHKLVFYHTDRFRKPRVQAIIKQEVPAFQDETREE